MVYLKNIIFSLSKTSRIKNIFLVIWKTTQCIACPSLILNYYFSFSKHFLWLKKYLTDSKYILVREAIGLRSVLLVL